MLTERRKLWEILNNAKATLEGISLEQAWSVLGPEIEQASDSMQKFLKTEYDTRAATAIYLHVVSRTANKKALDALRKDPSES